MRSLATLVLVLALAVAGCLGASEVSPSAEEEARAEVHVDADRPEPTFTDVAVGEAAAPDENATLLEAPRLVPGEWWRIHMWSDLTGEDVTFVRVVAKVEGDTYVVGMPHEGWYKEAVIYHVPFFGDVGADLSGYAHDILFQPVQFPLEDGATWQTEFEGPPKLTANVEVTSDTTADVAFTDADGNVHVTLTYDAARHEVVRFSHAIVEYEVVEHGYGFEGWVTVPRGEDLVFFHGRLGGATWIDPSSSLPFGLAPAPSPLETVEVNGGFNRLSFILGVGGTFGTQAGYYKETATAPDGTVFSAENAAGPLVLQFHEYANPDGEWQLEHLAAGPGIAFIEGIAYHQYDIHLPDGAVRSDHAHDVVR